MVGVELTRIINVQVTEIKKLDSLEKTISKEDVTKLIKRRIKECLDIDDVLVTDIKDFVREVPDADM